MNKKVLSLALALTMIISTIPSFAEFNEIEKVKKDNLNNEAAKRKIYVELDENKLIGNFNINIPVKVWYKGQYIYGDSNAVIKNDRTQVPVRFMSLAFGYNVAWDNDTKTITLNDNNANKIKLQIGSDIALVNGVESKLDNEVFANEKGRSYVPLRFVSEAFGKKVDFDSNAKVAVIGDGYKNNEYYPVRFFYGSWSDEFTKGDYITSEKINFTDLKPSIMWGNEVAKRYNTEKEFMEEFFSVNCGNFIPTTGYVENFLKMANNQLVGLTANEVIFPRKIKVSNEYIKNMNLYINDSNENNHNNLLKNTNTEYKNNIAPPLVMPGDYVMYEINNIPNELKIELSFIASDLTNSVKKRFDRPETIVTKDVQNFANDIAKCYIDSKWGYQKLKQETRVNNSIGHNAKDINEIARRYGLKTSSKAQEKQGGQYYENATLGYFNSSYARKIRLKYTVYNKLLHLIHSNHEFAHAKSIITGYAKGNQRSYLAVMFSYIESEESLNTHIIQVYEDKILDKSKFDTTPIEPSETFARWRYDKK